MISYVKRKCATCRFFAARDDGKFECRLNECSQNAPKIIGEDGEAVFPIVTSGCSCGYHDPNKAFRVEILINGKSIHKAIVPSEALSEDWCGTVLRDVIEILATFDPNEEAK